MIFLNPVTCVLAVKNELRPSESLIVVSTMGLVSIGVAVWWSRLFIRPTSRITDWLTLLLLYGGVSALVQALLPVSTPWYRKGQLLVPVLMFTIWGAGWAWRYVDILGAKTFWQRLRLMTVGILFVVGFPYALWLSVILVATLQDANFTWPAILPILWFVSVLCSIFGFAISARVQRVLNPTGTPAPLPPVMRD